MFADGFSEDKAHVRLSCPHIDGEDDPFSASTPFMIRLRSWKSAIWDLVAIRDEGYMPPSFWPADDGEGGNPHDEETYYSTS